MLGGPAVEIFNRRLGEIESTDLEEAIASSELLLCGTSWQADLEWRAIRLAREMGKRSVAFLDHWVNYRERFVRAGVEHLPDEIWVGDRDAERMARECFPGIEVRFRENPYFADIRRQCRDADLRVSGARGSERTALFVAENISTHALVQWGDERSLGYTEFDAIDYFLTNRNSLGLPIGRVIVRPHPSDTPGKYDAVRDAHSPLVQLSEGRTLVEEIADSDIVVGCESMAMVVALICNKIVVSCIPPQGRPCRLPQRSIMRMAIGPSS